MSVTSSAAHPAVSIGLDECAANPPAVLCGGRVGLLMNQASVDSRFRYAFDVLAESKAVRLGAIFSPQHGLWGEEQANMIETPHGRHPPLAGVPFYSLYSETRRPTAEMLRGLDALVIDLQDVGTRIYTYIWTVTHCLEACAAQGLPVVILDRPNPLGGVVIEGPPLDPEYASFVGRAPIPMRHALTIGELASHLNSSMHVSADLTVVPMGGWRRDMLWPETGLTWVPPSPNLPTFASALVYPGQVLLEGTNLSEGRGTTTPFEIVGAPFIEPFRLADALNEQVSSAPADAGTRTRAACDTRAGLAGAVFRPIRFRPTFDKWAGESFGGVFLHVTDARSFRPYATTLHILAAVKRLWPREFAWRPPSYEYESVHMPIDILSGSSQLREWLDAPPRETPIPQALVRDSDATDGPQWMGRVADHLLYG
jgi:uncharacterized protein YbbC (DUF1343 family)